MFFPDNAAQNTGCSCLNHICIRPGCHSSIAELVKQKRLHTPIDKELTWTNIAEAAELLVQQQVNGKVVLKVV